MHGLYISVGNYSLTLKNDSSNRTPSNCANCVRKESNFSVQQPSTNTFELRLFEQRQNANDKTQTTNTKKFLIAFLFIKHNACYFILIYTSIIFHKITQQECKALRFFFFNSTQIIRTIIFFKKLFHVFYTKLQPLKRKTSAPTSQKGRNRYLAHFIFV